MYMRVLRKMHIDSGELQKFSSDEFAGALSGCTERGQRPFKCSYCPYSASQKGNLKTHVLCVHRMPFDNSQYPDRRFKRSRHESESTDKIHEDGQWTNGSSNDNREAAFQE